MTPRSLFIIILKILGIFFLKDIVFSIIELFNAVLGPSFEDSKWMVILFSLLVLAIYVLITYILIFKPNIIINKLKLDVGFEEENFSMNMDHTVLINIAIIIAGLYLMIDKLPAFINQAFVYFRSRNISFLSNNSNNGMYVVQLGIEVVIAYILLANSRYISAFVTKKKREEL